MMFQKQQFLKAVYKLEEIPSHRLGEVILCGRSNVGKSSFINSFFNRKDLAKISSTPGKTRSINYYEIDNKFYIVDLPGYGYAKTSLSERKHWSKLIGEFLSKSKQIKLAIHFIDSRHNPMTLDIHLNMLLEEFNIPYIILLSKVDKLKQSELIKAGKSLKEFFPALDTKTNLVFYSSFKFKGRREIANLFSEMFY
jgi:GTP-binding protein